MKFINEFLGIEKSSATADMVVAELEKYFGRPVESRETKVAKNWGDIDKMDLDSDEVFISAEERKALEKDLLKGRSNEI